jgi:PAS domain S-box-containing protein
MVPANRAKDQYPAKVETASLELLDILPVLVWRAGRDARCDYFNQAWLEFTGRRLDQEVGDGWVEGVHPDDREPCVTDYLRAFEARKRFVLEYRLRHRDGEYRWIRDIGQPCFTASGEFSGYIGGCIDLTEREKAAEALRQAQESNESVLASMTDTYILFDGDWRYLYVNEAAVRAIGRPREQILGRTLWELYPDILGTELDDAYRRAMDERVGVACEFHYPIRNTWWENRFFPVREGLAVFATDITVRKAAEERIRVSEARLQAFMDNSPLLMFIKDIQGRYLHVNEQFTRSFGLDRRKVLLHTAAETFSPDLAARLEATDARVLATGAPVETEETVSLSDGVHTHIVCKFPIADAAGQITAVGGIRADITGRKRAEREVRESREQLRALASRLSAVREEERISIARNLHDELGQVLTAAKIDLSLLEQAVKSPKGRPSDAHILRELRSAGRTIDKGIEGVRRIAAEFRPAVLSELGLAAAVEWLAKDFKKRTRIGCKAVLSKSFPEPDQQRSTALYRILQEALTNVARHARAKTVEIALGESDGNYVLQVRDDGIGIPDDRLNDRHSLGLNGMRERALMFEGQVAIERGPGGGTTVSASIPRTAELRAG